MIQKIRNYTERAIRFAFRNVFRNTRFFITYAFHFFDPAYRLNPEFFSEAELSLSVQDGKSLIRFGDGEIYLINYGSVHYQRFDPRLRAMLMTIVQEYSENSPYLIGIPQQYLGQSNQELRAINLLHCWLPFKVTYTSRFNHRAPYFDAHLFYRSKSFEKIIERVLHDKKVILITRPYNWKLMQEAGIEKKLDITFVPCNDENSFDQFDSLVRAVRQLIPGGAESSYRVLLSAGPASKVLAYTFSKQGIVSYDLGTGIEAVYRPNQIEKLI